MAKEHNYTFDAGQPAFISFSQWTQSGDIVFDTPPDCYSVLRSTSETNTFSIREGYSFKEYWWDSANPANEWAKYCKARTPLRAVPLRNGGCIVLLIKFTSAYGPESSDPNKMYYIGKESLVKFRENESISGLWTCTVNRPAGTVGFAFTGKGTSAYQVNVNKTAHALGSTIGAREDAYGMPFTTADYEVWDSDSTGGASFKLLYGTITVNGGVNGGEPVTCD
jgi:hypothetical protein